MMLKNIRGLAALAAMLLALAGCGSVEAAITSWWDGLSTDKPAIPDVPDIDYSYPVTGTVAEQGTITFKFKPGFWEKLFHNPLPPVSTDESEVIVYLGFVSEFQWILSWGFPQERLIRIQVAWEDENKYFGKCDILFGTASREGRIAIRKDSNDPDTREIITRTVLNCAATETVSVEMNNFIVNGSTIHVLRHIPPYSWGEFVLDGRAYPLFSVMEENYYAKYPDFTERERGIEWNGIIFGHGTSRVETTAHHFLKNGQKFQITDNARTVMAELCGDIYTLYDTLPETERDNMKQALALLHAFRYMAKRLV